ncbi:NAD(P) transhydrogenase subunit alpha [Erythrobacteraceae bacterium CFH 75059]|uniref:NAD(P) transhydrogenase subunit alpha n=1 Tax=Qipengyuania thermophila TaxID=2509361 RepID=UPI001021C729|nr:NAD(P) transhydrogenase subunit alpha [Qipengyuania thermophila]TCD04900.1 NAD(P) transhydrogenase subunit alpha [Erythrobacteraceae bacterium CFH 75059]
MNAGAPRIGVPAERADGERRVAATPETVRKLIALGARVAVETGAGTHAAMGDSMFADAGADVCSRDAVFDGAEIVLAVNPPPVADLNGAAPGCQVVAIFDPARNSALVSDYAAAGLVALAMDQMPRITRAQSMDVLSSQANLAGYKAVIAAADRFGRALPMMMTAAGTIQAARVFVMGVGVAGLQAIATARRLGAVVSATDVRSATREQILSLGAKPVFVENVAGIEGEGAGGYAAEMSAEYQAAQAELVSAHITRQDIVITTALIPGRPAPRLVSDAQIASMKPGSVIFDLAVAQGGNVEGSVPDEVVMRHGVAVMGYRNTAAQLAADASALYARNLFNFLAAFWDKEAGGLILDDEIGGAVRLTGTRAEAETAPAIS